MDGVPVCDEISIYVYLYYSMRCTRSFAHVLAHMRSKVCCSLDACVRIYMLSIYTRCNMVYCACGMGQHDESYTLQYKSGTRSTFRVEDISLRRCVWTYFRDLHRVRRAYY